jgi:hypothetical protein
VLTVIMPKTANNRGAAEEDQGEDRQLKTEAAVPLELAGNSCPASRGRERD